MKNNIWCDMLKLLQKQINILSVRLNTAYFAKN